MMARPLHLLPYGHHTPAAKGGDIYTFGLPSHLMTYGLIANALFWSGLLMPFKANASPEMTYLQGYVTLLGVALALGGGTAILITVARKISVPLKTREFIAGFLNISVLTAAGMLLVNIIMRTV
ncbi:MAG: hypothetical protein JKY17_05600 [Magnetovibrio sp.]|nr:hypothetical protein [Magnetovibrio sp.]